MERAALSKHFGIKAKQIGLYGHAVETKAIAKNILTDLLARDGITHLFVMFDRESRTQSSARLAAEVSSEILRELPDIKICVAVPNQDIECWLFSDHEAASQVLKTKLGPRARFEGSKGTQALAKYIGPGKYDKVKHGVRLFGSIRWRIVAQRSGSANDSGIKEFFDSCPWLAA